MKPEGKMHPDDARDVEKGDEVIAMAEESQLKRERDSLREQLKEAIFAKDKWYLRAEALEQRLAKYVSQSVPEAEQQSMRQHYQRQVDSLEKQMAKFNEACATTAGRDYFKVCPKCGYGADK